jgi:hypothetical protein
MNAATHEKIKRWRAKRAIVREAAYLAKDWTALGKNAADWTMQQCAVHKRWFIYYHRRHQERELGRPLPPRVPRHWIGPTERERKARKAAATSPNMNVLRHLLT